LSSGREGEGLVFIWDHPKKKLGADSPCGAAGIFGEFHGKTYWFKGFLAGNLDLKAENFDS